MSGYWLTVLTTFASVAVALVGFAGLLTAFRSANTPLSLPDVVGIRILLIFSLSALIFALLPLLLVGDKGSWTAANLLLGLFLLFWLFRSPLWNRRRGYRPRRPAIFWTMLGCLGIAGLWLIIGAVTGKAGALAYCIGVGVSLLAAVLSFVSQVFALLPAEPAKSNGPDSSVEH